MSAFRRIRAIATKEVRQLRRDRLTIGMVIGVPLIQIALFGYAINMDVRYLRAAVADQANTTLSRRLVDDVGATQVVRLTRRVATAEELKELLRTGEITVGLFVPHDFEGFGVNRGRRLPVGEFKLGAGLEVECVLAAFRSEPETVLAAVGVDMLVWFVR